MEIERNIFTEEQERAIDLAQKGHNLFITGKAGVGKSFLLAHICRTLAPKHRIAVTCTTGIGCRNLPQELNPSTIHSYAGIKEGKGSPEYLINIVRGKEDAVRRWRSTDILVIDEISMMSAHLLEILDSIARSIREDERVFGGLQVIASGDFYQLPPVPNAHDPGCYAFESALWHGLFPHSIALDVIFRQNDNQLIEFINDLRQGSCSQKSREFALSVLSRPVEPGNFGCKFVTNLYTTNDDVNFHNFMKLQQVEGELFTFKATNQGERKLLNRSTTAEDVLHLKIGVPVVLLYNLGRRGLVNGLRGEVVSISSEGEPVVFFRDIDVTCPIHPVTWHVHDPVNPSKIIASRTQYPLKLAWAVTTHKSQGMSLSCVEIHCGKEFVSGQLYVAVSRAKTTAGLSLIGFNNANLFSPPARVVEFYNNLKCEEIVDTKKCCIEKVYLPTGSTQETIHIENYESVFDELSDNEMDEIDEIVKEYFEHHSNDDVDAEIVDLEEVLHNLDDVEELDEYDLSSPPHDFDFKMFLESMKVPNSTCTSSITPLSNDIIDTLLSERFFPKLKVFVTIQWKRVYSILYENLSRHKNKKVERRYFTAHFGKFHQLLIDPNVTNEYCSLLEIENQSKLDESHFSLLSDMLMAINRCVLTSVCEVLSQSQGGNANACGIYRSVYDIPTEGKGKIRHCGGWCIAKEREHMKRDLRSHMNSEDRIAHKKVYKDYRKKHLLESLTTPFDVIHRISRFKDTLEVTNSRQYRSKGLTHIKDDVFLFFMELEQRRIKLLNFHSLRANQEDLLAKSREIVLKDKQLRETWCKLFDTVAMQGDMQLIEKLYSSVISRFLNMGGKEFLKDLRRDLKVKKTEAHRKKLLEKSKADDLKNNKVNLDLILQDDSDGKVNSHRLLQAMVVKHPTIFCTRVYNRSELQVLYSLYDLPFKAGYSKEKLSDVLVKNIQERENMICHSLQQDTTVPMPLRTEQGNKSRKRFRPTTDELGILQKDHDQGDYKHTATQRAMEFNVSVKQIMDWHKKYQRK